MNFVTDKLCNYSNVIFQNWLKNVAYFAKIMTEGHCTRDTVLEI